LDEVAAANPGLATTLDVATSTEGRLVKGLKISSGPGKKAVWVDCVIHAREWLAAPVCMKLIEDVIADPARQAQVDWYVLPISNPDGYVFSWADVSIVNFQYVVLTET
jgi:murein tripeptide amidase MpaA